MNFDTEGAYFESPTQGQDFWVKFHLLIYISYFHEILPEFLKKIVKVANFGGPPRERGVELWKKEGLFEMPKTQGF